MVQPVMNMVAQSVSCRWLGDAPNTPMGQLPTMNTPLATTCTQTGGTLQPVAIYTDAQNYYTAGYKCCLAASASSMFPPMGQQSGIAVTTMQSGAPMQGGMQQTTVPQQSGEHPDA